MRALSKSLSVSRLAGFSVAELALSDAQADQTPLGATQQLLLLPSASQPSVDTPLPQRRTNARPRPPP